MHLIPPTSGEILLRGENVTGLDDRAFMKYRRQLQMVFQDPYASLNPRMNVRNLIAEPLETYRMFPGREETTRRVLELMETAGLPGETLYRYPHQDRADRPGAGPLRPQRRVPHLHSGCTLPEQLL